MSKLITAALAGTALLASAPALSKPGNGQGGGQSGSPATTGQGGGMGGAHSGHSTMSSQGPTNASPTAVERASPNSAVSTTTITDPATTTGTTRRDEARTNSQGPANASTTGIANANENSVLAGGSVAADTLPGLNTGLAVRSSTGTELGTISQVVTGTDGSIRLVVVTSASGETVRIPANQLSISGDVVTVTTP
jgi:hypothetical protein